VLSAKTINFCQRPTARWKHR